MDFYTLGDHCENQSVIAWWLITGALTPESKEFATAAGATAVIGKPCSFPDLTRRLAEHLASCG